MSSITPEELVHKIEQAFADVTYPGDDDLAHEGHSDEPIEVAKAFIGKRDWRQLEAKFLDDAPKGWGTALSFLSNNAFQFYLPAYLIADLRGELTLVDPSFHLCWGLTPLEEQKKIAKVWGGGTIGERMREKFAKYDDAQIDVIVDYLWWKLESSHYNPSIEQALENYWLPHRSERS